MGYIYGVMLPIHLGAKLVLQDVWSAELALQMTASGKIQKFKLREIARTLRVAA